MAETIRKYIISHSQVKEESSTWDPTRALVLIYQPCSGLGFPHVGPHRNMRAAGPSWSGGIAQPWPVKEKEQTTLR